MYGYIYLIVNNVNGKTYVGKHKSSKLYNQDKYMGSGTILKLAQKKYGIENFEKFLICYTESEEDACEKEKFWIAEYRRRGKAEYNIDKGGRGGGYEKPLSTRIKLSEAAKGRKLSEVTKKKISDANKGKHHKPHSEEAKKRMSLAKKGKPSPKRGCNLSDETKRKISEAKKGRPGISRPWTPEMREKLEGRKRSAESRKRMSDSHKNKAPWNKGKTGIGGHKLSEETRKKISEAQKGKHPSEETLKKLSESHKGKHWKLVDGKRVWF